MRTRPRTEQRRKKRARLRRPSHKLGIESWIAGRFNPHPAIFDLWRGKKPQIRLALVRRSGGTQAFALCARAEIFLRCSEVSGVQLRWAHRLEVYVPVD